MITLSLLEQFSNKYKIFGHESIWQDTLCFAGPLCRMIGNDDAIDAIILAMDFTNCGSINSNNKITIFRNSASHSAHFVAGCSD